jgi:tRNA threonylcarbamoyladenosine biosynthesis protein TsaE
MTVLDVRECGLSWETASPRETEALGQTLGSLLQPGDIVALFGELGSGKTVLVRGIVGGLGGSPEDVHSPSFTLVNEYICRPPTRAAAGGDFPWRFAHVDLYRIHSADELSGIGWDAYLHSGYVVAVEWTERALGWLPPDYLRVGLESLGGDRRHIRALAVGSRSERLLLEWMARAGIPAQAG